MTENHLKLDQEEANDMLVHIEHAFDVKFTNNDISAINTVGDILNTLMDKIQITQGKRCHTAMTFWRIRKTLQSVSKQDSKLVPKTPLKELKLGSSSNICRLLKKATKLNTPQLYLTKRALIIISAYFFISIAISLLWGIFYSIPIFFLFVISIQKLAPPRFDDKIVTLGDLCIHMAPQNYGYFLKDGGRHDKKLLWDALIYIIQIYAQIDPKDIKQETYILNKPFNEFIS